MARKILSKLVCGACQRPGGIYRSKTYHCYVCRICGAKFRRRMKLKFSFFKGLTFNNMAPSERVSYYIDYLSSTLHLNDGIRAKCHELYEKIKGKYLGVNPRALAGGIVYKVVSETINALSEAQVCAIIKVSEPTLKKAIELIKQQQ